MQKKSALITGGAVRLGRELALYLSDAGYNIALHYNSSEKQAKEVKELIEKKGNQCELFKQDLSKTNELHNFIQLVSKSFPNLDLLVNSASTYTSSPILKTTPDLFDSQFLVNLKAPFFLSKSFALTFKEGNIINILDNKIAFNQYPYAAYLLSKKSLAEFTTMAAQEFAPNIRVNGIAPGVILPAESRSQEYIQWRIQGIPLKKQGSTKNILQTLQFILNNDFLSGQIITVDGGENSSFIGKNATSDFKSEP